MSSNHGKIYGNPIYRMSNNGYMCITYNQYQVERYKLYHLYHYKTEDGNYVEKWTYIMSHNSIGWLIDYMNRMYDGRIVK